LLDPVILGVNMKLTDFESMSIDELWALHLEMDVVLTRRISAEKNQLDQRLRLLESGASGAKVGRERRPYPRVLPKYQNPDKPSETWAGRGKQPRWLTAQLRSGKKLEDFHIQLRLIGKRRREVAESLASIDGRLIQA
jgi:DNA-binding protein H-NS